jgi:hypothetical protein
MRTPHHPRSSLSRAYLLLALGLFFISFSAILIKSFPSRCSLNLR